MGFSHRRHCRGQRLAGLARLVGHFGQSEIENLGMPPLGDQDVRGLDVTMNNAFGVSCVQSVCDFDGQRENFLGFQWATRDLMLQSQSVQVLHDDEGLALMLTNLVNGANVGVIERGCRLRLPLKACQCLRIVGYIVRQELKSDKAVQVYILRFVDNTHPAAA